MSQQLVSQMLRRLAPKIRSPRAGAGYRLMGLGLALVVGGCAQTVAIGSLKQQPAQDLNGRSVYLEGKAVDRVPLLDGRVYRLEDSSGWIWVLSQGNADDITLGKTVKVKASLRYQPIPLGQREAQELYAIEEQRF